MPAHDQLKDDAAAYVLDSLEPAERVAFEAHLAECSDCAAEVRSLRAVTGALARGVPQRTPRPELRERVLGALPGVAPDKTTPRTAGRILRWLPAAAALALALGLGVYAVLLQGRLADARSALGVLAAPDVARIDLAGQTGAPLARARALWSRERGMIFSVTNLPPLPEGRVYQVWVVTAGAPVSAGLLTPDASGAGSAYFETAPDIPPPVAVAVTLEPAGGVATPTGDPYLVGKPTPL
ncbi:MAG TPA: anti-sigma factor [Vicinamibacterales bacterium]